MLSDRPFTLWLCRYCVCKEAMHDYFAFLDWCWCMVWLLCWCPAPCVMAGKWQLSFNISAVVLGFIIPFCFCQTSAPSRVTWGRRMRIRTHISHHSNSEPPGQEPRVVTLGLINDLQDRHNELFSHYYLITWTFNFLIYVWRRRTFPRIFTKRKTSKSIISWL